MSFLLLLQQNFTLALTVAGLLGLCVGSFLNVVIHRTPLIMQYEWRQESVSFWQEQADLAEEHKLALKNTIANDTPISLSLPPSRCPTCNHQIRWFENIPIASWLWLMGKCRGCQSPISIRYPLVELTTALLSVLVIYHFGASIQGLLALIFTWILVGLTGIDFDTQLLPDRLVYPLGMIGLLANAFGIFTTPTSAMLGGTLGFLAFYLVAKAYMLIRKKEGMGFGDFKLLAAIGAWTGVSVLPLIVLLSATLGAIIGGISVRFRQDKPFAFGPYIAIAGFIALLWGQDIMAWYLGQFPA